MFLFCSLFYRLNKFDKKLTILSDYLKKRNLALILENIFSILLKSGQKFYNKNTYPTHTAGASYLTLENLNNSNIVAAKKSSYYCLTPASSTTSLNDLNNSKHLLEDFSSANSSLVVNNSINNKKKTQKTKATLSAQQSLSNINFDEQKQGMTYFIDYLFFRAKGSFISDSKISKFFYL